MAGVAVVVAISAMQMPGMTAAIGGIEMGTAEVEVVTARIAGIDAKVPVACLPEQRTVEIGCCAEGIPLPGVEDVAQIQVTALPVYTKNVVNAGNSHQVVEVNLIGSLVLSVGKVQLVGHLIGQEQSLVAGLLVAHGIG